MEQNYINRPRWIQPMIFNKDIFFQQPNYCHYTVEVTNRYKGFSSVTQSCLTLCDPMNRSMPGLLVHHQLPKPCPLSRWCNPTISSSVIPFFSCPRSFPASRSFPMSQLFTSGIGVSASTSVLPMNTQDWSPLGWTGWIPLQSKELSRVFSSTTIWKYQFFGAQLSLWSNSQILTWLLEKA